MPTCSTVTAVSQGYDALAAPSTANVTGVRTFGTNEGAALFEDPDGSAPVAFDVFPGRAPTNGTAIQVRLGRPSADNTHGMFAIRTESLTKDFSIGFWRPRPYRALDGLNLEVAKGETFGFLGPNGAGKTTTLKLLMQLIYPTSGHAEILGRPVGDVDVKRRIGYLPESPYFYDYLTAEELLDYFARLFGYDSAERRRRVSALLDQVGIAGERRLPLRKFSKGMIQRVGIAQALINDPEVVFLDEPMSGLDPLGRRDVRNLILSLRDRGCTVFFSSHVLVGCRSAV